ncbi:hypothetical protein ACP70R_033513 [Stipagrostis hirtigluma subsp. patula]
MQFLDASYHFFLGKRRKENSIDDSDWPEVKLINGYAVFMGYLMMGVRGLGILVVTWTTVVLLGGFVSVLGKKDFWSLTVITLVQTAGVFNFLLKEKLSDFLHISSGLLGASIPMVLKTLPQVSGCKSYLWAIVLGVILALILTAIQLLVLVIILCPLAVLYVFGLYISTGVSLWRLIEHDFGNDDGGANMKPALEVLYTLVVVQSVFFGYKTIHALGAKVGLAESVASSRFDQNLVSAYLDNVVEGCEKDPSFATGKNLITYATDMILEPKSNDGFIAGVRALGEIIEEETLGPRSPS